MLRRRSAFQHGERRTGSLDPLLAFGLRHAAPAFERAFDEVHALVEPVAAEIDIRRLAPNRPDPVVGADHIAAAYLERVEPELLRQIVDRALDGEGRLRGAVAAKAAGGGHVGVDGIAAGFLVRATIG